MWMKLRRLLLKTVKFPLQRWRLTLFILTTFFVAKSVLNKRNRFSNDVTKFRIFKWSTNWDEQDNKRIFFHETSGRNYLNIRQTCAVESAALHNPQRPVHIIISASDEIGNSSTALWLQVLANYPNVDVVVVDDEEAYYRDTPLENWFIEG